MPRSRAPGSGQGDPRWQHGPSHGNIDAMNETPASAGHPDGSASPHLGHDLRALRRSRDDRVVAGVMSGLARVLGIDPVILRVVFAVLAVFGGVGVLLYALGWLLIPAEDEDGSILENALGRVEPRSPGAIPMAAILTIVVLVSSGLIMGGPWHGIVLLALAIVGVALLLRRDGGTANDDATAWDAPDGYEPPGRDSAAWSPVATTTSDADLSHTDLPDADPADLSEAGSTGAADPTGPAGSIPSAEPADAITGDPTGDTTGDLAHHTTQHSAESNAYQHVSAAVGWPEGPDWEPPARDWTPAATAQPTPPEPAPARSRLGRITIFAMVLALGALAVNDVYWASVPPAMYIALALTVVGVGLLLGTWYGRARGLIALGIVLALALLPTTVIDRWDGSIGTSSTVTITSVEQIPTGVVDIGAGIAEYDLSGLVLEDSHDVDLAFDQGAGELRITVPPTADVVLTADIGAGNIEAFGRTASGLGQELSFTDYGTDGPGGGTINLGIDLGTGQVRVNR